MKGVLVAVMLVAATVSGGAAPVRAGALGDAVVSVGGWLSELEAALSAWIDKTVGQITGAQDDTRSADAFRRLAIEAPEQLDVLAARAGYALSSYAVVRADRQDLTLNFRHDRDLATDERLALLQELNDRASIDARPELALVRILLDAADWRDAGPSARFRLTGVEVQVDDSVSSRLIFSDPAMVR